MEIYAQGFQFLEAPCWAPDGRLLVADVLGGGVHAIDENGTGEVVVPKRRGIGGMAIAADGGLVVTGRDVSNIGGGESRTLLRIEGIAGFNDLTTTADGALVVGSLTDSGMLKGPDRRPGSAYLVRAGGAALELYGELSLANGVVVDDARHRILHSDSGRYEIVEFDWDGEHASGRRTFTAFDCGTPDGLALDVEGGVWVACYDAGEVRRLDERGRVTAVVEIPSKRVTSVCFGGPGLSILFVTTGDHERADLGATVIAADVGVSGAPIPPAAV